MNVISAPSFGFRFGHAIGTLTREFMRSMKGTQPPVSNQTQAMVLPSTVASTRNDWGELCRIPTLARRGVDLNQWFETNTKASPPTKRRTRQSKSTNAKSAPLRMGPLDDLIAPVSI